MVKGFIFFRTGKIPFVIENYRMDLFTDDSLLEIFCKEYNFKENYNCLRLVHIWCESEAILTFCIQIASGVIF